MLNIRYLKSFLAVAEELSVSHAATRLFISQPALSRQIKDLESDLGIKLFFRRPGGVELTDEGKDFFSAAADIVVRSEEAVRMMRQRFPGPRDTLSIGFVPYFLPIEAIRILKINQPTIRLDLRELNPFRQVELLREGTLDVALFDGLEHLHADLTTVPLLHSPLMVALSENHSLAQKANLDLTSLSKYLFLGLHSSQDFGINSDLEHWCSESGFQPTIVQCANTPAGILRAVAAGEGLAILPAQAQTLSHQGVTFVPLQNPKMTSFFAVFCSNRSSHIAQLIQLLSQSSMQVTQRSDLRRSSLSLKTPRSGDVHADDLSKTM